MQVEKCGYNQSFQANFVKNQSFINVVKYAEKNNCLVTLDGALNALKKSNKGTICLLDGYTPNGKIYSTFMLNKKAIPNSAINAKTPAEASLDAIIELGFVGGKKFRELFGKRVRKNVSVNGILNEYTV
jgi:hypothetical protein